MLKQILVDERLDVDLFVLILAGANVASSLVTVFAVSPYGVERKALRVVAASHFGIMWSGSNTGIQRLYAVRCASFSSPLYVCNAASTW